jgi:hypothetical protein
MVRPLLKTKGELNRATWGATMPTELDAVLTEWGIWRAKKKPDQLGLIGLSGLGSNSAHLFSRIYKAPAS